ncbi:ABC transporter permease [Treponema brennaborense]|uniref:ABC-type transporter, integral membrane subunit n=1 Tax=Treponema brennaborense (strain DSM 12168 / CIP 105900 / DD5/3) TaxID=906968 RepID=F4LLA9_TREBD|nr:ABC transporter permease [Treponema brennaborense]AEE15587.1 ABC-type transporter, integral membrane subunit [Treponema brennaborense DSM 12168]
MSEIKNTLKLSPKEILNKYTNYITFVVLFVVLGILTRGGSLQLASLQNLVIAESVRAFAALGVGMIIISRGIDLSIGYVVCLTTSVAASFAQNVDYSAAMYPGVAFPVIVPIVAGIAVGGLFGAFNGVLVAYAKLPPFIATLGTLSLARGAQLIYTQAKVVGSLRDDYKHIAQGFVGPIPNLVIFVAIAALIVFVLLRHTKIGTNLYAIGGNPLAARVAGINVEHNLVFVYCFAGLLYGVAGVLQSSRLGLANSLTGNGMELDAIAAVTVGGVSQAGGVGTMGGMIIGVLTLGIINYGMTYLSIDSYYQLLMKGAIIIIAVFFDMRKHAKKS